MPQKRDILKKDLENISLKYKENIAKYITESPDLVKIKNEIDNNQKLKEILENNRFKDNTEFLLNYIRECFNDSLLSVDEAVKLNLFVAQKSVILGNIKEVNPPKNDESILKDLSEVFKKYGYTFEELNKEIREKLNEYADIAYVDFILSEFQKRGLTQDQLTYSQKSIYHIIIFKEEATFKKMMEFIDNNNCYPVTIIKWFPGAFRTETIRTHLNVEPGKSDAQDFSDDKENDYVNVPGNYESFIKNCELLKLILGKDKLESTDFATRETFINTNHGLVQKNLRILRDYKVIGENEYPKQTVALTGYHTAYHLDRFIETGNYEYITKNLSYVSVTKNPLKFYKIRRI